MNLILYRSVRSDHDTLGHVPHPTEEAVTWIDRKFIILIKQNLVQSEKVDLT